eukprot:TRINITY_DN16275_c0_g1_i1.p2 TRINITY_DN16275_c0_g1~~TRINITY_DN16275_c0_g1_i1.p2  ORF type:complete len:102 (+),score=15.55 TRINITY_DN16275_c0_g1_i1:213-518(+)
MQRLTWVQQGFGGDGEGVPCYVEPPVIAGHEFSGRVVKLGEGAAEKHGVKIGDLTVSEQIVPREDCKYCRNGNYQMCVPHHVYGFHQVTPRRHDKLSHLSI